MTVHTPIDTRRPGVPAWAIALTVFVFLIGGVYLATNLSGENPAFAIPGASAPAPSGAGGGGGGDAAVGEALVQQAGCAGCHGPDLGGSGTFPSLHGVAEGPVSENLQQLGADHPDDWIALWIHGDNPETQGLDRGGMPAFADQLSPEQIDSIVAYLKSL